MQIVSFNSARDDADDDADVEDLVIVEASDDISPSSFSPVVSSCSWSNLAL